MIIGDQMVNLGYLLVCNFGISLAPGLDVVHTVSNLDLTQEQSLENKDYRSD